MKEIPWNLVVVVLMATAQSVGIALGPGDLDFLSDGIQLADLPPFLATLSVVAAWAIKQQQAKDQVRAGFMHGNEAFNPIENGTGTVVFAGILVAGTAFALAIYSAPAILVVVVPLLVGVATVLVGPTAGMK